MLSGSRPLAYTRGGKGFSSGHHLKSPVPNLTDFSSAFPAGAKAEDTCVCVLLRDPVRLVLKDARSSSKEVRIRAPFFL